LKILYISEFIDQAIIRQGFSNYQMAFLQKPVSQEDLARKVGEVLDSQSVVSINKSISI